MVRAAFVADDFTGATDALWQFQRYGLRSRLFTSASQLTPENLDADYDVIGIATTARSATGTGAARVALPVLRTLAELQPELLQYKVCSTFDSSPNRGNIGAVIDAARAQLGFELPAPVLPAQPEFGRWTAFANHFANYAGQNYRLDRHEPMRSHPATPIDEADLRLHLGRQLAGEVGVLHVPLLADDAALTAALDNQMNGAASAFIVDAISNGDLVRFGAALRDLQSRVGRPLFAVGSGGLSYGYAAALVRGGPPVVPAPAHGEVPPPGGPVLAVSGSCSPVTDRQILTAEDAGWFSAHIDDADVSERVFAALQQGRHSVVYTARGASTGAAAADLSRRLGALALTAVGDGFTHRLLIAGGDTSGEIVSMAGVSAIEIASSIAVAGLLCRTFGESSVLDGAEVVLKGGQVGGDDFFLRVAGQQA
ncbi:four-carbon acid sugar kinase family protein [Mycolicibacterium sp. XJ870]